jgi:hypothetical protein
MTSTILPPDPDELARWRRAKERREIEEFAKWARAAEPDPLARAKWLFATLGVDVQFVRVGTINADEDLW